MQLGMHTKCIQNAYKHIKEEKSENSSLYFFFILSVFYLLLFAFTGNQTLLCPRLQAFTDPITPHCPFIRIRVAAVLGRPKKSPASTRVRMRGAARSGGIR